MTLMALKISHLGRLLDLRYEFTNFCLVIDSIFLPQNRTLN